jgi:hypothetical protein
VTKLGDVQGNSWTSIPVWGSFLQVRGVEGEDGVCGGEGVGLSVMSSGREIRSCLGLTQFERHVYGVATSNT